MSDLESFQFRGGALDELRAFPISARREAGYQLDLVQRGYDLVDWKPMKAMRAGVREVRMTDEEDEVRVMYVAKLKDVMYVLHCFKKTSKKISKTNLALTMKRYEELMQDSGNRFGRVWDAIEDTPEAAESMKIRSALMIALKNHIECVELTQKAAAKLLGVTQPRISDLQRGKINLFTLDALVNMAAAIGLHVRVHV